MSDPALYPRFAQERLAAALSDTPVVLMHGPRQCGKTTLARQAGDARGYAYFSFDDTVVLEAARADPLGFAADLPDRTILDEVQRAPWLFAALKTTVDRRRTPGRFLLTGSSNVLLVPQLSDSRAGRLEVLRLHPLSQGEMAGGRPRFIETLFSGMFPARMSERLGSSLAERIAAGGFPAALARASTGRRAAWYRNYVETLVQRDVQDLARIRALDALPRLLALAAAQTACLLNVSELAGPFQLTRPTIGDYVAVLERVFLLERLPPWHSNRLSRLVKTPKLHLGDTGVAASLLGLDSSALARDRAVLGRLLETFVFQELRRQASWLEGEPNFFHFRDKDGAKVDIVLERGAQEVAGVEVKAAATVAASDFRGLRRLREAAGERFAAGVVLYDGEASVGFGDRLHAVPLRELWERT
jgi:predicted AAA+ superfamily ATPase